MNATRSQLVTQYNRAKRLLWVEHFREASNFHTPGLFDTADLMAIGSRETNLDPKWLTKKGDHGHGAGLMQIDDRSFPEFTSSTKWKDARLGILYGAKVLRQKWDDLHNTAGKLLKFKGYAFVGPKVSGVTAQRIAIAAYNSGRAAPYHYAKRGNPDYGTTGKDYSSDVMQRAVIFRELLGKDGMLDKVSAAAQPKPDESLPLPNDSTTPGGQASPDPQGEPPPTDQGRSTEKIAITKPEPVGFLKGLWLRITGAFGGNVGYETLTSQAQQVGALGLSPDTWRFIGYAILVVSVVGIGAYIYSRYEEKKRNQRITDRLMQVNSTPTNTVELIDADMAELYEAEGWKVIAR